MCCIAHLLGVRAERYRMRSHGAVLLASARSLPFHEGATMVAVVLIFGFFGIALGTGWVAQLLVGKGRPIDWTQAFWVGLAGMGIATVIAFLVDRDAGSTFGLVGILVTVAAAAVIQS